MMVKFMKAISSILLCVCLTGSLGSAAERGPEYASFKKLEPMQSSIVGKVKVTLYEGLPHQAWESDVLKTELEKKETIKRHDFPFYKEPLKMSLEDMKSLLDLMKHKQSFLPFGGHKPCGGYHPDYSIVMDAGKEVVEIQVCFGCHEIKAYQGKEMAYCDINGPAYKQLEKLLKKYRKQRPKPRF